MTKPVCLIVGAGAGIGGNVAKRFAREVHHAGFELNLRAHSGLAWWNQAGNPDLIET